MTHSYSIFDNYSEFTKEFTYYLGRALADEKTRLGKLKRMACYCRNYDNCETKAGLIITKRECWQIAINLLHAN